MIKISKSFAKWTVAILAAIVLVYTTNSYGVNIVSYFKTTDTIPAANLSTGSGAKTQARFYLAKSATVTAANIYVRTDGSDTACDGTANVAAGTGACAYAHVSRAIDDVNAAPGFTADIVVNMGAGTYSTAENWDIAVLPGQVTFTSGALNTLTHEGSVVIVGDSSTNAGQFASINNGAAVVTNSVTKLAQQTFNLGAYRTTVGGANGLLFVASSASSNTTVTIVDPGGVGTGGTAPASVTASGNDVTITLDRNVGGTAVTTTLTGISGATMPAPLNATPAVVGTGSTIATAWAKTNVSYSATVTDGSHWMAVNSSGFTSSLFTALPTCRPSVARTSTSPNLVLITTATSFPTAANNDTGVMTLSPWNTVYTGAITMRAPTLAGSTFVSTVGIQFPAGSTFNHMNLTCSRITGGNQTDSSLSGSFVSSTMNMFIRDRVNGASITNSLLASTVSVAGPMGGYSTNVGTGAASSRAHIVVGNTSGTTIGIMTNPASITAITTSDFEGTGDGVYCFGCRIGSVTSAGTGVLSFDVTGRAWYVAFGSFVNTRGVWTGKVTVSSVVDWNSMLEAATVSGLSNTANAGQDIIVGTTGVAAFGNSTNAADLAMFTQN